MRRRVRAFALRSEKERLGIDEDPTVLTKPVALQAKALPPQAVAAARSRLRSRRRSTVLQTPRRRRMLIGIAFVAAPCVRRRGAYSVPRSPSRPRGARNAAPHPFSATC